MHYGGAPPHLSLASGCRAGDSRAATAADAQRWLTGRPALARRAMDKMVHATLWPLLGRTFKASEPSTGFPLLPGAHWDRMHLQVRFNRPSRRRQACLGLARLAALVVGNQSSRWIESSR